MTKINLGDKVKDSVTGFAGIVVAKTEWLHGCIRIMVQPDKLQKDGSLADAVQFDEPQLIMVKPKKVPEGSRLTGGPKPYPTR